MTSLEIRQSAPQFRFVNDELFRFRTGARCARLFGLWAGQVLGLAGDGLDDYSSAIMSEMIATPDGDAVISRIARDFARREINVTKADLHAKFNAFLGRAQAELTGTA